MDRWYGLSREAYAEFFEHGRLRGVEMQAHQEVHDCSPETVAELARQRDVLVASVRRGKQRCAPHAAHLDGLLSVLQGGRK